jgi:putative ABC transport system permease protein
MPSVKRLRSLFRRDRMERELDAELAFHVDMQTAEYVRQGMSPDDARRTVRQLFGVVDHVKDDVRDTWLTRFMETLAQDARYSVRSLRKQAGYAAAVIVTMALGIGANTAIFSVVNAVVLQPLPYARGDDLLLLRQPRGRFDNVGFSIKDIDDLKQRAQTLDAVVEFHSMYFILLGGEEPARVSTGVVSWDYFDALGVKPLLGRTFRADDDHADRPATLLLSHEYWQRAFGGDPSVVGRVFEMNDRPHTVIGVLPEVPMYPQPNDVYMPRSACPFRMDPQFADRRGRGMAGALGRRRPGVPLDEVQSELAAVTQRLHQEFADQYSQLPGDLTAVPLRREFSRNFESTLAILLGTAAFVLLIVCASVANLSVARTMRRERELALRTSLGATRARLIRQLLTENVILSIAGGAAGLLLAFIGMDLLVGYAERFTTRAGEIRIDRPVLVFTLAISLATGLLSGIFPALSKRFLFVPGTSPTNRSPLPRRDLRRALIVAQVAASFMLLIGAGLMLRSLVKLTLVDPGFSSDHVLTMQIDMNFSKYVDVRQRTDYLDRLLRRLRDIPGVSSVGASGTIPFLMRPGSALSRFVIEGRPAMPDDGAPQASLLIASEDYFRAMRIPLVAGRFFEATDNLDAPNVVIVNQSLAERYWTAGNAVGQRISGDGSEWHTIVGVVANVRQQLAVAPVEEIYSPMRQTPYVSTHWTIRAASAPDALAPVVRAAVYSVDPDQPIHQLRPLDDVRTASLTPPRLTATLIGIFAGLALLITASGIGGVIAFSVSQRTHEFGLRVALGARRGNVVSLVVGEGVRLTLMGLAIGVVGAPLLSGLLSTMLFGVEPTDAVTYVSVSSMLLIVAGLACLLPALRAASIDPMQALRVA